MARDFLGGHLLAAMPNMTDPRFEQSVVLICVHTQDSAMGVVINKILKDVTLGGLVSELVLDVDPAIANQPILYGGPVDMDRGVVLHSLDYCSPHTAEITPAIGLTGTREILVDMTQGGADGGPERALLALGYAGWGAGQLEDEIASNAWLHCPADLDLVFNTPFAEKWRKTLLKLGVTDAMFNQEWAVPRDRDARLH